MTTMNYTNEFYVKPARHLAAVANALRVLEVPGVEVNEAEARIAVAVPAGIDTMTHWRALRTLRDAVIAKAEAGSPDLV